MISNLSSKLPKNRQAHLFLVVGVLLFSAPQPASADLTYVGSQNGDDYVMTISGSVDLAGASYVTTTAAFTNFQTASQFAQIGNGNSSDFFVIGPPGSNPLPFFGTTFANNFSSGDVVGFAGENPNGMFFSVPDGYSSSAPLLATTVWQNQTAASLGFVPGTYNHSFLNNNVTFHISGIPEPATAGLMNLALIWLGCRRRKPQFVS